MSNLCKANKKVQLNNAFYQLKPIFNRIESMFERKNKNQYFFLEIFRAKFDTLLKFFTVFQNIEHN